MVKKPLNEKNRRKSKNVKKQTHFSKYHYLFPLNFQF